MLSPPPFSVSLHATEIFRFLIHVSLVNQCQTSITTAFSIIIIGFLLPHPTHTHTHTQTVIYPLWQIDMWVFSTSLFLENSNRTAIPSTLDGVWNSLHLCSAFNILHIFSIILLCMSLVKVLSVCLTFSCSCVRSNPVLRWELKIFHYCFNKTLPLVQKLMVKALQWIHACIKNKWI